MTELRMMQIASKFASEAFPEKIVTIGSGEIKFDIDASAEPGTLYGEGWFHCMVYMREKGVDIDEIFKDIDICR